VLFGEAPHRCAGWLHGLRGDLGVVICSPLGAEEECAHRSLLHLADGLAERAMVALRFDFPGCGDSEGDSLQDARLDTWIAALEGAAGFLRNEIGCKQVALVGLRLGAALVGVTAARLDTPWVVLWAPVSNGRAYARELRAVAALGAGHADGDTELSVAGHLVSAEFVEALALLRARDWDMKGVRRALLLERDDGSPDARLREALRASGVELDEHIFAGYTAMFDRPQNTAVPTAAVAGLCDWMAARANAAQAHVSHTQSRAYRQVGGEAAAELSTSAYRERRLMLGARRRLVGVLCEPTGARVSAPIVVLLNAGSVNHTGPGRLYARLARELAHASVPSLRVDLSMLGDGIVAGVPEENDCYAEACQRDVLELLEDLRGRLGFGEVVLGGLCSGAYWALQGALDPRARGVRAVAMIHPMAIARPPQSGGSGAPDAAEALRYRQSMRSWAKWKKLLTLQAHPLAALKVLLRRTLSVFTATLRELGRCVGLRPAGGVGQGLRRLREQGVLLGVFVGSTEPGYLLLRQESPREVDAGLRSSAIQVFDLGDCDHAFTAEAAKQRLFKAFGSFVAGLRAS
jgi:hypothetical protein